MDRDQYDQQQMIGSAEDMGGFGGSQVARRSTSFVMGEMQQSTEQYHSSLQREKQVDFEGVVSCELPKSSNHEQQFVSSHERQVGALNSNSDTLVNNSGAPVRFKDNRITIRSSIQGVSGGKTAASQRSKFQHKHPELHQQQSVSSKKEQQNITQHQKLLHQKTSGGYSSPKNPLVDLHSDLQTSGACASNDLLSQSFMTGEHQILSLQETSNALDLVPLQIRTINQKGIVQQANTKANSRRDEISSNFKEVDRSNYVAKIDETCGSLAVRKENSETVAIGSETNQKAQMTRNGNKVRQSTQIQPVVGNGKVNSLEREKDLDQASIPLPATIGKQEYKEEDSRKVQ